MCSPKAGRKAAELSSATIYSEPREGLNAGMALESRHADLFVLQHTRVSLVGNIAKIELQCSRPRRSYDMPRIQPPEFLLLERQNSALLPFCHGNTTSTTLPHAILVHRYDAHNLYHVIEGYIGMMQMAYMAQMDPRDVPVLFIDDYPPHDLDAIWTSSMGNQKLGVDPFLLRENQGKSSLCIENLVAGLSARTGSMFLSTWGMHVSCPDGNAMIQSMVQYLIARFPGVGDIAPNSLAMNSSSTNTSSSSSSTTTRTARVLFIDRRNYGTRKIQRQIDPDSLSQLQYQVEHNSTRDDGIQVKFVIWNPEGIPLTDQLQEVRRAHVLIGAHGAGLTHLVFQVPQHSAAIEIVPPDYERQPNAVVVSNIFHNVAQWSHRPFIRVDAPQMPILSTAVIEDITRSISSLIDRVVASYTTLS
jgi:hypothetical protein